MLRKKSNYITHINRKISCNNTNNTINNTINITLTNFGNEDYNKLTNDEQLKILKSNKQCMSNLIKYFIYILYFYLKIKLMTSKKLNIIMKN
jgi:hypothetical protein